MTNTLIDQTSNLMKAELNLAAWAQDQAEKFVNAMREQGKKNNQIPILETPTDLTIRATLSMFETVRGMIEYVEHGSETVPTEDHISDGHTVTMFRGEDVG